MQRGVNGEIGTIYSRLGKKTEARRAFEKELLIDSNDASALRGLGELFLEEDDLTRALEYLLASAALLEISPETHYLLAKTLMALNRPDDALRAIERAETIAWVYTSYRIAPEINHNDVARLALASRQRARVIYRSGVLTRRAASCQSSVLEKRMSKRVRLIARRLRMQ